VEQSASSMLSKVLRGEDTQGVQPVSWRRTAGPSASPTAPTAGNRSEPSKHVFKSDQSEQETAALHARIAEVEALAERRVREARETGFREGDAAARNQMQPALEKLAQSIQEIGNLRAKLRHEAEGDLLKLALAIARKILHRELSADPESISGLIRVAVEKIRMQEILRVRIHPQHHPAVQQILARMSTGAPIEIFPDQKMQLGGVVVETTRGEFDASVDLQLREIERGLTDRLAHGAK
jgi:flagellar assembly protein FliH